MPPIVRIDQAETHRLIPAQYADEGTTVLARLMENEGLLADIADLDNATNDRLLAESDLLPGIDSRELVFGIPSYRIINAAFCHSSPGGTRFGPAGRNAWYAAFELETSIAEVAHHRRTWLLETGWGKADTADYADYLADFRAEFHDLRGTVEYADCLDPVSYSASQALAARLLREGSAGVVYPSVRRTAGTCLACFRPVLVSNVRSGSYRLSFPEPKANPLVTAL